MPVNIACLALKSGCRLALNYEGIYRIVEVHAVGVNTDGHQVMKVWQTAGGSGRGGPTRWKIIRLDDASNLFITDEISQAPRNGYKSDDKDLQFIICQI